ncbi:MAG TPA: hypothetical protein VKE74_29245 [Gemmataceae bacterium]|nr:hypothetical protein [Gemmataceae bacterium]
MSATAKSDDLHAETSALADEVADQLTRLLDHLPDAALRVRATALVEIGRMADKAGRLAAAAERSAAKPTARTPGTHSAERSGTPMAASRRA